MIEEITMNKRGVVTIPARFRKKFGLSEDDKLIIEESVQGLLLRPAVSMPLEIYSEERIAEFQEDEAAVGQKLDRLETTRG